MKTHLIPLRSGARRVACALAGSGLLSLAACAQIPRLDPPPAPKAVGELESARSFSAPEAAWPGDGWWRAYQDPQLDALIEAALRNAPELALAEARLHGAAAAVQGAGATLRPNVTANALLSEDKQSYNYLIPRQALPQGGHDYGLATLNLSWELDFWGKNRAALAAAVSEQRAATVEVAQARLILSTSVASAYAGLVHLYALRDNAAQTLDLRTKTVALFRQRNEFGLENVASVRQVEARQAAAQGELLAIDERIGLQRNAIAALLERVPTAALPSRALPRGSRAPRACLLSSRSISSAAGRTSSPPACAPKRRPNGSSRPRRASIRA